MANLGESKNPMSSSDSVPINRIQREAGKPSTATDWGKQSGVIGSDLPVKNTPQPYVLTGKMGK